MILKLIMMLVGRLTPEQKQELLDLLTKLITAGAEGAVAGAMQGKIKQ